MSLLAVDEAMLVVLICGERDSRDKCLADKMSVEVVVRHVSPPSDVYTKLNSLRLASCILPDDIQQLVRSYTAALQNGKLSVKFLFVRFLAAVVLMSATAP